MDYGNIIIMSADRNGSSAFQREVAHISLNQDYSIWLSECFSQDARKNQPPTWYNGNEYPPKKVIEAINIGTGKSVLLKIQITWDMFNETFFEIPAERRIFFHRNLFDSNLSRCVALLTGRWFTFPQETVEKTHIEIPEEYFRFRLEYRINKYMNNIQRVLDWCNECSRYETYKYKNNDTLTVPNPDKSSVVTNYDRLKEIYNEYQDIKVIENLVDSKIQEFSK